MFISYNTRVRVRLTDAGRAMHLARWSIEAAVARSKNRDPGPYPGIVTNADGTSDWPLGALLHCFGGAGIQSNHVLPFFPQIEIVEGPPPLTASFRAD